MKQSSEEQMSKGHYGRLLVMTAISFIAMFTLMYAMVDRISNVYLNANQIYMAGLMTAAMVIIELLVMSGMYNDKRRNALIIGAGVVALAACFGFIRRQTAVSERQFLRSMIPHHASALLMCKQTSLHDPELVKLCDSIIRGQQSEIELMTTKLREMNK